LVLAEKGKCENELLKTNSWKWKRN
jgi:hypothetical protein